MQDFTLHNKTGVHSPGYLYSAGLNGIMINRALFVSQERVNAYEPDLFEAIRELALPLLRIKGYFVFDVQPSQVERAIERLYNEEVHNESIRNKSICLFMNCNKG